MNSLSWIVSLFIPMLLHTILSEASVLLLGNSGNATLCTTAAAVLTIPIAAAMFFKDQNKRRSQNNTDTKKSDTKAAESTVKNSVLFGAFCLAAGGVLNIIWSGVLNLLQIGSFFSNAAQEALLASELVLQIVGLGLIVPIAEELVFRALIYNRMKAMLSVRMSVFFSALLFAVYHGNPIQIIFAFPMALVMAALYEHGQNFAFPVLFHVGANLTAVLVNLR